MKRKHLDIFKEYPNDLIDLTINRWIHSARDRRILHLKLVDGFTYEDVADIMDMSSKRIQDIIYAHETIIYRHLND
jgi:hypothetical protein